MSRYTPPTIESYGGIKQFLNATTAKHNGYGYEDLEKNWKWGAPEGMNVTNLAKMFGVSWPTMTGYIDRMHEENGKPRPSTADA